MFYQPICKLKTVYVTFYFQKLNIAMFAPLYY